MLQTQAGGAQAKVREEERHQTAAGKLKDEIRELQVEEENNIKLPKGIGKGGRVQDEAKLMRDLDGKKTKKVMEESLRRVREKLARNPRAKEYEGVSSSIADADADVDGAHNKVEEKNTEEIMLKRFIGS